MRRSFFLVFFLSLVSLVMYLACRFVYLFFETGFSLSPQYRFFSVFVLWVWIMAYVPSEILCREKGIVWVKKVAANSLGLLSISVVTSCIGFLLFTVLSPTPVLTSGVAVVTLALAVLARRNANCTDVKLVSIPLEKGSSEKRLKIVQISDIHLNGLQSVAWVSRMVNQVNALKPDVIVLTGDLLDISPKFVVEHLSILAQLSATAKLAVSGNHDFYMGYGHYEEALRRIGFQNLDNKKVRVQSVQFIGIPDSQSTQFSGESSQLSSLLNRCDRTQPIVLLNHRPDGFPQAANQGVTLQLSGHTHAGQLPPWDILVRLRYRYAYGLSRYKASYIYTTKGTGTWGPPMRLYRPSEIVCLTI